MAKQMKPLLGEVTAFTIATPDLEVSLAWYLLLGYKEVMRADWPFPWIQISDGVVLIMLRFDPKPYIALTYYVKNIEQVVAAVEQKGISFIHKAQAGDMVKRYLFASPDGLNISLVSMVEGFKQPAGPGMLAMPKEDYLKPERYINKTCGLYGEFAHPVADLEKSISFWKTLGFEVVSTFTSPYPWAILSDGLSILGLHQTDSFSYPSITYFAADMHEKIAQLKANGLEGIIVQDRANAVLTTPEGQHLFLYSMGLPTSAAKDISIQQLPQTILETERLWLKELSPEVMDIVMTNYTNDELKTFLGLDDKGLETEKHNYSKGLTTYRISFKAFLLVQKETGKIIGKAGYHMWYLQHARAELGYAMSDESAKQKGLMTEAISAIINYGFTRMDLNRIEAMVSPENVASLNILDRFGFKQEGLLRAHYCKNHKMEDSAIFSLLRNEWMGNAEMSGN